MSALPRRPWAVLGLVLGLAMLVLPGAVIGLEQHGRGDAGSLTAAEAAGRGTEGALAPGPPSAPRRLRIASIDSTAEVLPVGVRRGSLELPPDPRVVGWWSAGGWPNAGSGTTLIAGHVDSATAGPGALFRLADVGLGTDVRLQTLDGTVRYRVVARRVYRKAELPAELFRAVGPPRLALVTCGGPYDRRTRHYRDNVVVYAVPT
jgi:hypothetical protein